MGYEAIAGIADRYGAKTLFDESIAEYTSFRIGGKCDVIVMPNSADCIKELVSYCKQTGTKYYILGKCTNVLISDSGLRGVVIIIDGDYSGVRREGNRLICEAGASLTKICGAARNEGLTGLEFAYGIPGSAGGALYMNAGAYGGEMKDVIVYCDYLDSDGSVKRMNRDEMELSYRHSVFCGTDKIILSVCFELTDGDKEKIADDMNAIMNKRRDKQPLEYPSAGSTFKRPEGYFAAKLIEDSGLKGFTVGGAQVSEKHSGFVINKGGATCEDVKRLIDEVKKKVLEDSGVALECEILLTE
ncbi:MAG: UDP-N-acetylmuramate dehydrogenase [Ruminiclostridium sp.]|nr:UDP-N-acetylmuramate dehydrogenase [Ruminiclostridium sp.]